MRSSREKLIKDCEFAIDKILCNGSTYVASQQFFKEVIYYLRHYVDVVPCKDCKFGKRVINGAGEPSVQCLNDDLFMTGDLHMPDWFCADGERKSK